MFEPALRMLLTAVMEDYCAKGAYCDLCETGTPRDVDGVPLDDIHHKADCPIGMAQFALVEEP